ncbi:MAG: serine hydrolase [Rhodocyclales bacterium]|nr:serine hydrolase [Rhodocyclales bacterium]
MSNSIDRLLAYQIEARHTPGAVVHVERAGQVLAHCATGRLRPQSDEPMHDGALFRLASLSKSIVSFAALMQVEEGLLELDAAASDYLPVLAGLRMQPGARPQRAPTVRDLMRHTSGLAYATEIPDAELRAAAARADFAGQMPYVDAAAFLDALAAAPLAAQPGAAFRYGYSTDVLGMIVAKLDGLPLGLALKTRIFERLGMRDTGFEVPSSAQARLAAAYAEDAAWQARVAGYGVRRADRPWLESGGGGLVATLGDYACFARMLANGGSHDGERLLSSALFQEMCRNQLPQGIDGPVGFTGPGFGFGLALALRLDWGAAAMPCAAGEMAWSGISGTALFVHPDQRWFALCFTSNMSSRMMARMEFRRAAGLL